MNSTRINYRTSFEYPLTSSVVLGVMFSGGLYAMILTGSLSSQLLQRLCCGHWTACVSITLFLVGITYLVNKLLAAIAQIRLTRATVNALTELIHEGHETLPAERPRWLEASWLSLPVAWQFSWFGMRLNRILSLQLKRGRRDALEQDLQSLSKIDLLRQCESYGIVRLILCVIPLIGILGTLITNSAVRLPNRVAESATTELASNAQIATSFPATMAYISLDTTVLALALTLVTMSLRFIVDRTERGLLARIDQGVQDTLIEFLVVDPHDAEESLFAPVRQMTTELIASIHQIVEQQANIWSRSIFESQRQWSTWTQAASECIASNLKETITGALKNHAGRLEKIQEEGSRQIDTRWQQWQTTLSDQARAMSSQQKELIRQTDSIQQLVSATTDLRKLEETILESVGRLENIHRFEEASQCIGEAVAVLGTSLERAGIIRGAPVRPRVVRKPDSPDSLEEQRKSA